MLRSSFGGGGGDFLRKSDDFDMTGSGYCRHDENGPKKDATCLSLVRFEKVSVRVDCRNQTASYDWK